MSPAEDMNMQMRDRFAAIWSVVYDDPETVGKIFSS